MSVPRREDDRRGEKRSDPGGESEDEDFERKVVGRAGRMALPPAFRPVAVEPGATLDRLPLDVQRTLGGFLGADDLRTLARVSHRGRYVVNRMRAAEEDEERVGRFLERLKQRHAANAPGDSLESQLASARAFDWSGAVNLTLPIHLYTIIPTILAACHRTLRCLQAPDLMVKAALGRLLATCSQLTTLDVHSIHPSVGTLLGRADVRLESLSLKPFQTTTFLTTYLAEFDSKPSLQIHTLRVTVANMASINRYRRHFKLRHCSLLSDVRLESDGGFFGEASVVSQLRVLNLYGVHLESYTALANAPHLYDVVFPFIRMPIELFTHPTLRNVDLRDESPNVMRTGYLPRIRLPNLAQLVVEAAFPRDERIEFARRLGLRDAAAGQDADITFGSRLGLYVRIGKRLETAAPHIDRAPPV